MKYCPNCEQEVSDYAVSCPKCGNALSTDVVNKVEVLETKKRKSISSILLIIPLIVIVILAIILIYKFWDVWQTPVKLEPIVEKEIEYNSTDAIEDVEQSIKEGDIYLLLQSSSTEKGMFRYEEIDEVTINNTECEETKENWIVKSEGTFVGYNAVYGSKPRGTYNFVVIQTISFDDSWEEPIISVEKIKK